MAIDYFRLEIIRAGDGSVVTAIGYDLRQVGRHPLTGQTYDFRGKAGDLAFSAVLLPDDTPRELKDRLKNPVAFAAALEEAELVIDRRTRLPRYRANAQLGKRAVAALPRNMQKPELIELAVRYAKVTYVDRGIPVHVAIHSTGPEDPNPHVHYTIATRRLGADGFAKHKARDLNPTFARGKSGKGFIAEQDYLNEQWRAFQNAFFREKGIDLQVDPNRLVPGTHVGAGRFSRDSELVCAELDAEQRGIDLLQALGRSLAGDAAIEPDPDGAVAIALVLDELTKRQATFTGRDVMRLLRKHLIRGAEAEALRDRILGDGNVLRLSVPDGVPEHYTTQYVRNQERHALELSKQIAKGASGVRLGRLETARQRVVEQMTLSAEQRAALERATSQAGLAIWQGIAGAGKSYAISALRQVYEQAGFRVVGLAPTNAVAQALRGDGFAEASTVHRALYCQERRCRGTAPYDEMTCIIVDEAAMLDADTYERLLSLVAESGARLVLVGDDRQLASVQRGGVYEVLKATHGCAELKEVRRQEADWAKAATLAFAEGRIAEGLGAYDAHGFVHWSADLQDAYDGLVGRWYEDFLREPLANTFVYASTNAAVDRLNETLRAAFWHGRPDQPEYEIEARHGPLKLRVQDRIQFHANDPKARIFNGVVGTVREITPLSVVVETDAGDTVAFAPGAFKEWSYGFAGTIYRGQGKTNTRAYALYDHPFAWGARATYVALTRHRAAVRLFVPRSLAPDIATLVRQASRTDRSAPSLFFNVAPKAGLEPAQAANAAAAPSGPASPIGGPSEPQREHGSRPRSDKPATLTREDCLKLPPKAFARHYWAQANAVEAPGLTPDAREFHRRQKVLVETVARERGLRPGSGKPVTHLFGRGLYDTDPVQDHPAFEPRDGRPDVRPLMFTPAQTPADGLFKICRELWRFDPAVLNAWVAEIQRCSSGLGDNNRDGTARLAAQNAMWLIHMVASWPGRAVAAGASTEPCPSLPTDVPLHRIRAIGGLSRGRNATRILSAEEMGRERDELSEGLTTWPPEPAAWIARYMQLATVKPQDLPELAERAAKAMCQRDETWRTEALELWTVGEALESHAPDPEDVAMAGPRWRLAEPRLRPVVEACIAFARKVVRWPWQEPDDEAALLAQMPTYAPPAPRPAATAPKPAARPSKSVTPTAAARDVKPLIGWADMAPWTRQAKLQELSAKSDAELKALVDAGEAAYQLAVSKGQPNATDYLWGMELAVDLLARRYVERSNQRQGPVAQPSPSPTPSTQRARPKVKDDRPEL